MDTPLYKDVENLIRELRDYYMTSRASGHTRLLTEGTKNYSGRAIVLGDTVHRANFLEKQAGDNVRGVSIQSVLSGGVLKGLRLPIAFDNWTLINLFNSVLFEFERLRWEKKGADESSEGPEGSPDERKE